MLNTNVNLYKLYEVSRMMLRFDTWRSGNFTLDRKTINSYGKSVVNPRRYRRAGGKSSISDYTPLQANIKFLNDNVSEISAFMVKVKMQQAKIHLKVLENDKPLGECLSAFSNEGTAFFRQTIEWFINVNLKLYLARVTVSVMSDVVEIRDAGQDTIFSFPHSELPLGQDLLDKVKTVLQVGK